MGQIVKFPVQAAKFGYKRVRKGARGAENPNQLHLFPAPTAQILNFASGLSCFEQALLMDERGDPRAIEFYQKAIDVEDSVADAYCNLGIIESKQRNTARAFDCFTISLKHNPRHFEAHYNLGNLYFDVDDFRLAQIHYEMASKVDAAFPNVYFNLAIVQAINNQLAPAIATLTTYRQMVSEDEARNADELLENLRRSLAASKDSRSNTT
jgi:tetratricopeptide (TPR) repeat protein